MSLWETLTKQRGPLYIDRDELKAMDETQQAIVARKFLRYAKWVFGFAIFAILWDHYVFGEWIWTRFYVFWSDIFRTLLN